MGVASRDQNWNTARSALLQSKAALVEESLRQRASVYRAWVNAHLMRPGDATALLRSDAAHYVALAPDLLAELESVICAPTNPKPKTQHRHAPAK